MLPLKPKPNQLTEIPSHIQITHCPPGVAAGFRILDLPREGEQNTRGGRWTPKLGAEGYEDERFDIPAWQTRPR